MIALKAWPQIIQQECLEFLEGSTPVAHLVFLLGKELSKSPLQRRIVE